ncbi:MAG: site-2 protease family protein [Fibrobacterota bacterium]
MILLMRFGGCEVRVQRTVALFSLILIFVLVYAMFPYYFPGLGWAVYWVMGLTVYAGLVISVLVHEGGHCIAARFLGLKIASVMLYPFGGVLETFRLRSIREECWVALAGPAASMIFAVLFFLLYVAGKVFIWPISGLGILIFLCYANLLLVVINLLPGYPLDGGRIFRAGLWFVTRSYHYAAVVCAVAGNFLALFLIFCGVAYTLQGVIAGAVWWIFLGVSVSLASQLEIIRYSLRRELSSSSVAEVMCRNPVSVPSCISLSSFVERYLLCSRQPVYPVIGTEGAVGSVTFRRFRAVPAQEWECTTVAEITEPFSEFDSVGEGMDWLEFISFVHRGGSSSCMVLDENGSFLGLVRLEDVVSALVEKHA